MFIIRKTQPEDSPRINQIASRFDFEIPDKCYTSHVIARDSGQVCAFGLIRPILEAVIVTSGTPREILEETELLLGQFLVDAKMLGENQIHAFVNNQAFARLLKKKYGLQNPVGEALVLVLE